LALPEKAVCVKPSISKLLLVMRGSEEVNPIFQTPCEEIYPASPVGILNTMEWFPG